MTVVNQPLLGVSLGLGLDAGGTETRWALANDQGVVLTQGAVAPLSALLLLNADGRSELELRLVELAGVVGQAVSAYAASGGQGAGRAGVLRGVMGSFTGLAQPSAELNQMVANVFSLSLPAVSVLADIELTHILHFGRTPGCVIYAGTGSYASAFDTSNQLQRVGGRGGLLDDAGSGYWIAKEALRLIWRAEDECPGQWQQSDLARCVFQKMGASDWAGTRAFVYGESNAKARGKLAMLALAVAEAAHAGDEVALGILRAAGSELARLGSVVLKRFGVQPIVFAGRVFMLHPEIKRALHAALPAGVQTSESHTVVHHASAQRAALSSI